MQQTEGIQKDYVLRNENVSEHRIVENLTREAFYNIYSPGCSEHYLVHILRKSPDFIPELNYVAQKGNELIGNIMYAKSYIKAEDGTTYDVITFGPLSVLPKEQKKGVGSTLVKKTLLLAKQAGYGAVLIYGSPDYYSRFGFTGAKNFKIKTSDGHYKAALMALELKEGYLSDKQGYFFEGSSYDIDETKAEEFDKNFPAKQKLYDTPSQKQFMRDLTSFED